MPFYSDILSHLGSPASGSETIIAIPRLISSQSHSLRSSENLLYLGILCHLYYSLMIKMDCHIRIRKIHAYVHWFLVCYYLCFSSPYSSYMYIGDEV
ncbi:uncharacterized protein LOC114265028 isoform X3 [Camellia sinensis]|uniref:uncharacterized protein LOC114265028 isoform X3 n=1 Tax=Camellia sinensis TaxID=4442 RepID=UPI001036723B|nr:uncharacterized protein LOC114265028 isoform X3 [Camellia sinensis]